MAERSSRRMFADWRLLALGGALLVGLLLVVLVTLFSATPNPHAGVMQADDGRGHMPACEPGNYSSVPPTSGCHSDTPANWGVYEQPVDATQMIHNLEHGGIVIWYQAEQVEAANIDALGDFVTARLGEARFKFILAPWDGEDFGHPFAITAWRQLLYLDGVDLAAIRGFAEAHYGRSPEPQGGPGPPA